MSVSTALFIYFIYYLEMTWKTQINHILSQSSMFNVFMFPNVSVFLWEQLFSNSDSWSFVHIRNVLFCGRAPSSFVYEWTHTAWNECLTLRDVYLALFWVRIKHQVMHRLSCLFEFKSIFIHTGSWKFLCEHTPEKKCEGRIYVILKVGGDMSDNRLTTLYFFCIMVHLMVSKCTCFAIVLSIFL